MKNSIISLILVIALALSLAACGDKSGKESKTDGSQSQQAASGANDVSGESKTESDSKDAQTSETASGESANQAAPSSSDKNTTSDKEETKNKLTPGNANLDNAYDFVELCDYEDYAIDWESGNGAAALESRLSSNYTPNENKITDRAVKKGDIVNIDYVGKKNGVAFQGGTASGYDLTIGSGQFIDGFEDGLIGVSVGETVDLNLTFPENYGTAELAGADVVFTVTVNYISEKTYLEKDIEAAKRECAFDVMLVYVAENSNFLSLPQEDYEVYEAQLVEQYGEETGKYYAEETTKQLVAIFAIAKNEGIKISDKEYKEKLDFLASSNNMTAEELEEASGESYVQLMVLLDKVKSLFVDEKYIGK